MRHDAKFWFRMSSALKARAQAMAEDQEKDLAEYIREAVREKVERDEAAKQKKARP
jgi:predicted HicB family RNase H-like nuclease